MSNPNERLLAAFDGHDVEAIRAALDAGADALAPVRDKLPINWLLEEYHRTDRLPDCLRLLFDRGAVLQDSTIAPVLLNDVTEIRTAIKANPALLKHRTNLVSA